MTIDPFATASSLVSQLRAKELSSRELLDFYLDRVERLNPALNAVVTLDADRAHAAATAADNAAARGEWFGPLHGLPMTVKDCFETAGLRTTCGDLSLSDHVPERDALAVERLRNAGAVIFGKTNTPTQTLDIQTDNPVFGRTNNPWDLSRIPGGSSGGSAAAIAAGLTSLELGSDIGGSIRIPSHCCGVFGHKPSWGVVPERGHIPGPPGSLHKRDLNVNGPIARSADDLALALSVMAGPDEQDGEGWRLELPAPRHQELRHFRAGAWLDDPYNPTDRAVLSVLETAVSRLAEEGLKVDATARPGFTLEENHTIYGPLLNAAISGILGGAPPHNEWLALDEKRQGLRRKWREFFSRYDIMLAPVLLTTAMEHFGATAMQQRRLVVDGTEREFLKVIVWSGMATPTYLPSTVIPVGRTAAGLPVGMQAVGPFLGDRTTLAFAAAASRVLGGFVAPPGY